MRVTKQKELIYATVMNSCDHPTAETVFERVRKQLPKVSLGTVYRNLAILAENGDIKRIVVPNLPDRFDKTVAHHSHFYCRKCGKVFDVDFDNVQQLIDDASEKLGVITENIDVIFAGICKDCINKD